MAEPGEIASLILQRTPKFELLLPPEERGVRISHELIQEEDDARMLVRRITIDGLLVDIEMSRRTYLLDWQRSNETSFAMLIEFLSGCVGLAGSS